MGLFNGFSFISPVEFCYWTMILVQGLLLRYGRLGKVLYVIFLVLLITSIIGIVLAVVLNEQSMNIWFCLSISFVHLDS